MMLERARSLLRHYFKLEKNLELNVEEHSGAVTLANSQISKSKPVYMLLPFERRIALVGRFL